MQHGYVNVLEGIQIAFKLADCKFVLVDLGLVDSDLLNENWYFLIYFDDCYIFYSNLFFQESYLRLKFDYLFSQLRSISFRAVSSVLEVFELLL